MTPEQQRRRDRLWLFWVNVQGTRGAKTKLAKFLHVTPARAAQLLSNETRKRAAMLTRLAPYQITRIEYVLIKQMLENENYDSRRV